jgi:hypothetical protein
MRYSEPEWLVSLRRLAAAKSVAGERQTLATPRRSSAEIARKIDAIEHCYGTHLPQSYRDFLVNYDGWRHAFRNASLLSSEEVLSPSLLLRFEDAMLEISRLNADDDPRGLVQLESHLIPIGCDENMDVVFVFDMMSVAQDGEMEIIAWISGLGVRVGNFAELLELLADLTETPISRTHSGYETSKATAAA